MFFFDTQIRDQKLVPTGNKLNVSKNSSKFRTLFPTTTTSSEAPGNGPVPVHSRRGLTYWDVGALYAKGKEQLHPKCLSESASQGS